MFEQVQKYFQKPDPKELVRKWQADLRTEQRKLDRQIRDIQLEEKKVQKVIKEAAKRNDIATCKTLAKEVVHARKTVGRLYVNKAHMMSISHALTEQLAMVRVAGTLQASAEVMKLVNDSMKLPALRTTMFNMSKEMQRAGLIEEMMGEAIDDALGAEELEEETDAEVDKVLAEVAGETLAAMPAARARPAPARAQPQAAAEEDEEEEDMAGLQQRLDAIRT